MVLNIAFLWRSPWFSSSRVGSLSVSRPVVVHTGLEVVIPNAS